MNDNNGQRGFALVTVMLLLGLIMTLLAGYFSLTRVELTTTKSSMDSFRGFYASEAGLNVRADLVRATFVGYNLPAGVSPVTGGAIEPCFGTNQGSGDFACVRYDIQERDVATYMEEAPGNPTPILIPRGEPFQNLNAQEYRYSTYSEASSVDGFPEAVLEMHFKNRLVPMFQFAAFYNKDLEILPGQAMTLAGPVHTNGDLYLDTKDTGAGLSMLGQITTVKDIYKGRKDANSCQAGDVSVADPENVTALPGCSTGRRKYTDSDVQPWNGQILMGYDVLTVPAPEALDPTPGEIYWDKADIRIMLDVTPATPTISVYDTVGVIDTTLTTALTACNAIDHRTTFKNRREDLDIDMMDVDAVALLNCIHGASLMGVGKTLADTTEGGLVWYLGVLGPDQDTFNNYGVRVSNGGTLASTAALAPPIRGLTVVTNQAIYIWGDWNAVDKKPSAFLADSLNVLSNQWDDSKDTLIVNNRLVTSPTTINAAFLAGTDDTGGAAGKDNGEYNGGLENYPRLHEKWTNQTLLYRGSFVSLNTPRHVDGLWVYGEPQYKAPIRDFGYDTDFNDATKLPPLSPRFVYLRQELFVRKFEL